MTLVIHAVDTDNTVEEKNPNSAIWAPKTCCDPYRQEVNAACPKRSRAVRFLWPPTPRDAPASRPVRSFGLNDVDAADQLFVGE